MSEYFPWREHHITRPTGWVTAASTCGKCKTRDAVSVPADKHALWMEGDGAGRRPDVDAVFPDLTPSQRDILIGADTTRPMPYYICHRCWDSVMAGDE